MKHIGEEKRVKFTPNVVEISEVSIGQVVAVGFDGHDSRMYKFSHFLPYSQGNALLPHSNEKRKSLHERYGYLSYKCLYSLSKQGMVEGLPSIKFSNGTCK